MALLLSLLMVSASADVGKATLPAVSAPGATLVLSPAEREWLRTAPEVVVAVQPEYAPFTFQDAQGRPTGYSNQLFELAARKAGLRYRFQTGLSWSEMLDAARSGQIDVLTCLWISEDRKRFLRFVTPPYLRHTLAVATRADDPHPSRHDEMEGKRLVLVKDFAINERLRARYPRARFVQADTASDALKQVSFGQADGYIDNISLVHYNIARLGLVNVRVGEEFVVPGYDYYMAVRRDLPYLQSILSKAQQAVTPDEQRQLELRWLHPPEPRLRAFARRYAATGVVSLLLLLLGSATLVWWNRRLAREVSLRKQAQAEASERALAIKASTRLQQSLLDSAQAAILVIDREGRWSMVNPFAERLLGWRADELLGKVIRYDQGELPDTAPLLLDPAYIITTVERLSAMLGRRVPADWRAMYALAELQRAPVDVLMQHKDGHEVPVQLSLSSILDETGQALGLVAVAVDLTVQKQLQAQLRESEAQAQQANVAKSAFLAAMSHEIRTPMNGVVGMIEVLAHTTLDAEQRRVLDIVQQSSQSLLQIIGDILDFSKIEAGRMELVPAPAPLSVLTHSAVNNYSSAALKKGLVLHCHDDPRLAPAHVVDVLRWRQITSNLLSNAIKFTQTGRIDVALDWEADHDDGALGSQTVCLRVSDTGMGVSAEQQARLFHPFGQASGDIQQVYGGTGLGLVISRRLAQLMGGELTMQSVLDQGTTMRLCVRLPRADPNLVGAESARTSGNAAFTPRTPPSVADAERQHCLVLVVDDHPTNRLVIARQLALAGFASECTNDGEEGLQAWRSGRFGLVLTDVHMPRMDGYQLVQAIRAEETQRDIAPTPVVGLTANAMKADARRCIEAGMDDVLIKPAPVAVLAECLQRWLPHAVDAPATSAQPLAPVMSSSSAQPLPVLDSSMLATLVGSEPELTQAVLADFLDSIRIDLDALEQVRASGDRAAIVHQAHRIKGAAQLIGASALAHAAAELEGAGGQHDDTALPPLMDNLVASAEALREHVQHSEALRPRP